MRVVLIHGAWGTAASWDEFTAAWGDRSPAVETITLPSEDATSDLHADADAVVTLCNGIDDDVVLVAHSYGGAVATQASTAIPRLRGIVYVAAFRPEPGTSVSEMARRAGERSQLDAAINLEGSQLFLNMDLAPAALYGHASAEVVARNLALLHRQSILTFQQNVDAAVPDNVRTHYVICMEDLAVPVDIQEQMAATCETSSRLIASHCPQNEEPTFLVSDLLSVFNGWAITTT
jgi:pimeloyl-ACP methyl ester carboxylesterase